jgi:hypothetical protein
LPFGLLVAHLLTVNALMFCQGTSELTPGACRFSHFGLLIVGLQIVFVGVFLAGYSGLHHDGFTASHDGFLHSLVTFVLLGKGPETLFFEEIDSFVVSVCDNNGEALILSAAL